MTNHGSASLPIKKVHWTFLIGKCRRYLCSGYAVAKVPATLAERRLRAMAAFDRLTSRGPPCTPGLHPNLLRLRGKTPFCLINQQNPYSKNISET